MMPQVTAAKVTLQIAEREDAAWKELKLCYAMSAPRLDPFQPCLLLYMSCRVQKSELQLDCVKWRMLSSRFRGALTLFREGGKQPQRKETRPWVFAVGRAPLSRNTTGLSWGLGEWVAGSGLLLMWGTCCRSNGHGHGGWAPR